MAKGKGADQATAPEAEAKRRDRAAAKTAAARENKRFSDMFWSDAERGVALSIVAHLDIQIASFLESAFAGARNKEILSFFRPDNPSSSLGAKIRLIYLLGYIKSETFDDLKRITNVRNSFAHDTSATSFSYAPIASECAELRIFSNALAFFSNGDEENGRHQISFYESAGYDLKNHRWGFVAAVGFLSNQFKAHRHVARNVRTNHIPHLF